MTMTHVEINRRLALAIGYAPKAVRVDPSGTVYVERLISYSSCLGISSYGWDDFDYMDWGVIGPIMERYRMFPMWHATSREFGIFKRGWTYSECPRTCVALAVIKAHERGLL